MWQSLITFLFFILVCQNYGLKIDHDIKLRINDGPMGRIFDGIGGLSGGGATSKLLMNYQEPYRSQILDYLFKPNFGAAVHILKVEIGGDSQSTEGTEASHMHVPWEENYSRGYEWWLMVEAKKRNPDILLYGLPWAFPGWLSGGTQNPWDRPDQVAVYILKWILGAKKYYGLTIDYVGIWNEKTYTTGYVKLLRSMLDKNGLSHVKIIVADSNWNPAADAMKDPVFKKSFYGIGAHYPGTLSSKQAQASGMPLWSSEDYSTFNNDVGAGCWARILNQNYVNGLMTSTISWNLIASYYDNLPYKRCSLMTANEPWSGHYELPGTLWVTAHTTQFTKPGWRYLAHGSGVGKLPQGGSYVTLISPDGKDVTIIIETMSHDHSLCIRPALPAYNVTTQTVNFDIGGTLSVGVLHQWKSQLSFVKNRASSYFKKMTDITVTGGRFVMTLEPDSLITLSTISAANHGATPASPTSQPFPVPYKDDFEGYSPAMEPYHLTPQIGSFEVFRLAPKRNVMGLANQVIKQTVLQRPIDWCYQTNIKPIAVIGDYNWKKVQVSITLRISSINGTNGAFLATRIDQGGCGAYAAKGIFVWIMKSTNQVIVSGDLQRQKVYMTWWMPVTVNQDYSISIVDNGNTVDVYVNAVLLCHISHFFPDTPINGFVGLGTDNFGIAYFDDLNISSATAGHGSDVRLPPKPMDRYLMQKKILKMLTDENQFFAGNKL